MLIASDGEAFSIALFRLVPWVASCSRHSLCWLGEEKKQEHDDVIRDESRQTIQSTMQALCCMLWKYSVLGSRVQQP